MRSFKFIWGGGFQRKPPMSLHLLFDKYRITISPSDCEEIQSIQKFLTSLSFSVIQFLAKTCVLYTLIVV